MFPSQSQPRRYSVELQHKKLETKFPDIGGRRAVTATDFQFCYRSMDLAIEPYGILSVTTSTPNVLSTKEKTLPEVELVCTYTQIMTGNLCRPTVLVQLKSELRSLGHFPG